MMPEVVISYWLCLVGTMLPLCQEQVLTAKVPLTHCLEYAPGFIAWHRPPSFEWWVGPETPREIRGVIRCWGGKYV